MITHFLAIALLAVLPESAPQIIAPFKDAASCTAAAAKANKEDADLKSAEAKEAGAQYVCLTFVYPKT